jgi:uncharacterized membrane protein SpoIIM required for sporulation
MKETRFIAQNKEKWLDSENLLKESDKDPEKLSNLFTQVVDDLSYSRTYYQNRSVRVYLNQVAREYFSIIYGSHKEKKNRFKMFWLDELPQIIIYSRRQLLISLLVFLLAAAVGVFSSIEDPEFTGTILGSSYVEMTKENIEKGDPMAVYKKGHQVDMFLGITLNNLMVAFRTYVFGVFLSIGTLAILLYNGIMVGCFQYFFVERGLLAESALTIWLHGTLEISSIILAGGAGLTLGTGLIFPGTYSRLQAFQLSAMRSLKLMLGISPIFVVAGIIESFLTRYTDVPDILRLFLIVLSATFIIGYFVVFPWLKSRRGFDAPLVEVKLPPATQEMPSFDRVKNNAEILKDAFLFYKRNANRVLTWVFWITVGMTTADFVMSLTREIRFDEYVSPEWWNTLLSDMFYALGTPTAPYLIINTLGAGLIVYRVIHIADAEARKEPVKVKFVALLKTLLVTSVIYITILFLGGWGSFLVLLGYFVILLWAYTQLTEKSNTLNALAETFRLLAANFGQVLGLHFILLLTAFSFLLVLSAPLIYMYTTILQWNFAETDAWAKNVVTYVELFIKIFAFNLVIPILVASAAYMYFSLAEVLTADHLKRSIALVGNKLTKNSKS